MIKKIIYSALWIGFSGLALAGTSNTTNTTNAIELLDLRGKGADQSSAQLEGCARAAVLMYHSFGGKKTFVNVSEKLLREQMQYLKDHDYNVIGIHAFVENLLEKKPFTPKTVLITLDDGWASQEIAMKVFSEHGFPATFALVSSYQESKGSTFLKNTHFEKYKDADFTYVNHSYNHNPNYYLVDPELDLQKSEPYFKRTFGALEPFYVYPYGLQNDKIKAALKKRGYIAAFGVSAHLTDMRHVNMLDIPRFNMNEEVSVNVLSSWLSGLSASQCNYKVSVGKGSKKKKDPAVLPNPTLPSEPNSVPNIVPLDLHNVNKPLPENPTDSVKLPAESVIPQDKEPSVPLDASSSKASDSSGEEAKIVQ